MYSKEQSSGSTANTNKNKETKEQRHETRNVKRKKERASPTNNKSWWQSSPSQPRDIKSSHRTATNVSRREERKTTTGRQKQTGQQAKRKNKPTNDNEHQQRLMAPHSPTEKS